MAANKSKINILQLLEQKKVNVRKAEGNKSDVWNDFLLIYFGKDYAYNPGQYTGYVLCNYCKNALKHNKSTSGTSHLQDRLTHCVTSSKNEKLKQIPVTSYFRSTRTLSASGLFF